MFERLRVHAERPQIRQIQRVASLLAQGLPAVVPTESTYTLICLPESAEAQSAIRRLRQLDETHLWSLVCADLSQAARYVRMDNKAHRILHRLLPGPYTFILPALSALPKRVFGKRRDVGIRIPEHTVFHMLLEAVGQPLLSTTLQFPGEEYPATDPEEFINQLKGQSIVVIDAGWCGMVTTTVVDLCGDEPELLREGLGEWP